MNVVLDANQVESGDIEDEVCGGAVKKTDLSYVNSEKIFWTYRKITQCP